MSKQIKALILVGVLGLIIWTAFSVYFSLTSKEVEFSYEQYIEPIEDSFDNTFDGKIENRVQTHLPVSPSEFTKYLK